MQVQFAGFLCQFGSTNWHIIRTSQIDMFGKPVIADFTVVIRGYVRGASVSELTGLMMAYETAFRDNTGDFRILNQGAATAHEIISADTVDGVKCVRFEWLPGKPPATEYVNRRSWSATLKAQKILSDGLLFWSESVRITAPGPVRLWQPSLFNNPQPQRVQAVASQIAIQRGNAIGVETWPGFPDYVFDEFNLKVKASWEEATTPRRMGQHPMQWPISWFYVFEGLNFVGAPSLPTP